MNRRLLVPLVIFLVLAGFLFVGLWRDPREVPSPLVGKPAPSVSSMFRRRSWAPPT